VTAREQQLGLDGLDRQAALVLALLDGTAAIRWAASAVRDALGADVGYAALVIDDLDTMQVIATAGTQAIGDVVIPAGRGLGGLVATLRHPIAVADYLSAEEITHDFDVHVAAEGLCGVAAAPITYGHQFKGVLFAGFRSPHAFSPDEISTLSDLSRRTGLAVGIAERARDMADVAVHEERRRVAQALHDSLGATLFTIGATLRTLRTEVAGAAAGGTPDDLAERLAYLEEQTALASATVRRTLLALNDSPREVALGVALQADCRAFAERTGISARALVLGELPALAPTRTRELLATVRESLLNVEKHAAARSVVVSACVEGGGVLVVFTDDGVGRQEAAGPGGLGLAAAGERVERLGGRLRVVDGDDGGCAVRVWIPC
jgi:LuxR family transcriptional regulator, regulator of acetate metabolism